MTVDPALLPLLPARARRAGRLLVPHEPHASAGHVVQSAGVPLTEVGVLTVDGAPVSPADRPPPGSVLHAGAAARPQPVPAGGLLLDVHLGSLARRLRLLLTADRGLLVRRALVRGALVRGAGAEEQLADVLDRFRPPLAPLTRCTACGRVYWRGAHARRIDELLRRAEQLTRGGG
ncbi:hypothetical protein GTR00_05840 [Kineococcus sp. T90]|nr:hypothetical protein [Kineococcus indalonis]